MYLLINPQTLPLWCKPHLNYCKTHFVFYLCHSLETVSWGLVLVPIRIGWTLGLLYCCLLIPSASLLGWNSCFLNLSCLLFDLLPCCAVSSIFQGFTYSGNIYWACVRHSARHEGPRSKRNGQCHCLQDEDVQLCDNTMANMGWVRTKCLVA